MHDDKIDLIIIVMGEFNRKYKGYVLWKMLVQEYLKK